ncbi:MAG: hypothetical protein J6M93_03565 [Succinivibrio sp.]|nr:hypothetical protein [Succinivibrio sp.]
MTAHHKGPYDDIITVSYPFALSRPRMSRLDRAAQFAPFEALEGSREMIVESERQTVTDKPLAEDELEELNRKLGYLVENKITNLRISVLVFEKDEFKEGGALKTYEGILRFIDMNSGLLILSDGTKLPFGSIRDFHCLCEQDCKEK